MNSFTVVNLYLTINLTQSANIGNVPNIRRTFDESNQFFEICNSHIKTQTVVQKIFLLYLCFRLWLGRSQEGYHFAQHVDCNVTD